MFFDGNVDKLNSSLREACRVAQKIIGDFLAGQLQILWIFSLDILISES